MARPRPRLRATGTMHAHPGPVDYLCIYPLFSGNGEAESFPMRIQVKQAMQAGTRTSQLAISISALRNCAMSSSWHGLFWVPWYSADRAVRRDVRKTYVRETRRAEGSTACPSTLAHASLKPTQLQRCHLSSGIIRLGPRLVAYKPSRGVCVPPC